MNLNLSNSMNRKTKLKASAFVSTKLTNEAHAETLAKHFFQYYNKKNLDYIDSYEIAIILIDIYKSIGKDYKPTDKDVKEY